MTMKFRAQGFTLIEILIALAIFSVVAVSAAVALHAILNTREHLKTVDDRIKQILTATTILRRDVTQIISRPVKDTSGGLLPALRIPDRSQLEFTRAGYTNPMQISARSSLQRVAYYVKNDKLYRTTWPVLDRAPHTKPVNKVMLDQVTGLEMSFINLQGESVESWSTTADPNALLPRAIIITLMLKDLGPLKLVLPIRGRGNA